MNQERCLCCGDYLVFCRCKVRDAMIRPLTEEDVRRIVREELDKWGMTA